MLDLAGTDWACLSYTTIKYHFPQFHICSFLLSIKGFKKSFPRCEAVLAFQSKGLLGIDGEYFPPMSEQCAFHTNGWCKESSSLCFLLWFMSLDFRGVAKGSVAEGLVAEGLVAEGLIASSYLWVQRTVYSAPHCFLPASCCALLIFAKMRILGVLPSSEAATFWPRGAWSMRQISDHCAVFPLTFHCQSTSGYHNSQHISCRNNCSPGFLEYLGMCFSTTHFSLCIIHERYQGRTCPKGCLLPHSLLPPYFITWMCHDKLANLHPCCDWEPCFPACSITTAKRLDFSYFSPQRCPAGTLWGFRLWTSSLTGISCRT